MQTRLMVGAVFVGWVCVMNIVTVVHTQQMSFEPKTNAYANMDHGQGPGVYSCGDTVANTVSGQVISLVAAGEASLNCSLTLASPPGTQLSLTVVRLSLPRLPNGSSCDGNRLRILDGSDPQRAASLLPSLPDGLCGSAVPNQPVVSPGNRVKLHLETTMSFVESSFQINFTAFKTNPDGDCFECEVDSTHEWAFCINPSLVCDGVQNCPQRTEETRQNCQNPTAPPPSGSPAFLIPGILIGIAFLFITIFLISLLLAKRVFTKRANESALHRRSYDMADRRGSRHAHGAGDLQRAGSVGDTVYMGPRHGVHTALVLPPPAPPIKPVQTVMPGSPPPYSTLPRQSELRLQMGEETEPTPRPRAGSSSHGHQRDTAIPQ